ncbi:ferritin-like domain-containing protein [Hoeflea sp.]|uniref:ferritin-like domain-containing protein n=1 Tax=Hoeflea sp. TaxID=1940281 RepID=UPI003B520B93
MNGGDRAPRRAEPDVDDEAPGHPRSLRDGAARAIRAADLDVKTALTQETARRWHGRRISLRSPLDTLAPDRPGRPARPELVPPTKVTRRSLHSQRGRVALLHAIAHIELNAVDLALDIVARFAAAPMPQSFFDGWMKVAFEEAKHFNLVRDRLRDLGADYGDMPAHDGLWQAAHDTRNDLAARLAVVPLILEARGLDVTPSLRAKMREAGDEKSAAVLDIIYEDEKKHVAIGAKWFRFLCAREGKDAASSFEKLVRANFRGGLKPPFNDLARAAAGLTPTFYRALSSQNMS